MNPNEKLRSALATVHHAYFLGLQLMVARECGADVTRAWTFRLFRRQHEQYFLSGLEKLGLSAEPAAVACAKYHVLSNRIGGVAVEYAEESDRKAWVRFRYPRWMFDGPVLCGIPQDGWGLVSKIGLGPDDILVVNGWVVGGVEEDWNENKR